MAKVSPSRLVSPADCPVICSSRASVPPSALEAASAARWPQAGRKLAAGAAPIAGGRALVPPHGCTPLPRDGKSTAGRG